MDAIFGRPIKPGHVSSAANQLEMWQAETFDADLIEKEISFGAKLGYTVFRIFLHDLVYFHDPAGFKSRMNTVLNSLDKYGMKALFTIFDTENVITNPTLGKQPRPRPAVCNSVYTYTPNITILNNASTHEILKPYVIDVVGTFANDSRVLAWDVYNEPGFGGSDNNNPIQEKLLQLAFEWARSVDPIQPLTSRIDFNTHALPVEVNNSDVISIHIYSNAADFENNIKACQQYQRPIIVTEFMARELSCYYSNALPIGKKYNVGMIAWGHVMGKTEWNMPWDSYNKNYVKYPPTMWFQDTFRPDGCPLGYHSKVNNWTCYNAYDTPKSWVDVQAACKSDLSYPVTINNAFENSDVKTYASSLTNCNGFYIGLSQIRNNTWKWPMTVPYNNPSYRNWKNGYPTNDANANCVVLNPSDGSWSNQDCSTQRCYICSY
uniref:C-type lectin domain-containing protein n=1 Tax=Acrobeloides nanus TaxID=290746 RepID=A0A914CHC2_9BILA